MTIEVRNLTGFNVDKNLLKKIAARVLKGEKKSGYAISVVFVNKPEIKTLNRIYRKQNKITDILSFGGKSAIRLIDVDRCLGELVLCPEKIRDNATKFRNTYRNELKMIFIHGILHLLGYDHENGEKQARRMQLKQDQYLSKFLR